MDHGERVNGLRKGNSYRLTMKWLNSDGHTVPYYWYCWQAKIDGIPSSPSYRSYSSVRLDGNEILAGNGWVAENADGLLTSHVDMHDPDEYGFGGGNVAGSLTATLHVLNISVVGIKFNHTPSLSTADALTIRPNGTSVYDVSHGEWTESGRTNYPACHVGGVTPTVKVKFRVEPSESCSSLEISADVYGFALSLLRRPMRARRFADVCAKDGREVRGARESAGERDVQQTGAGRLRHQLQGAVDAAAREKAAGRECAMPSV